MSERFCFVISPMGEEDSPTRARADYVLKTYIKPACEKVGYQAVRADHEDFANIPQGIASAVQNAPMAISYFGAPAVSVEGDPLWNPNVMVETGSRVASRLPLVLMCDRDASGRAAPMPITLQSWNRVLLPGPQGAATPHDWADPNPQATIDVLVKKITAESKQVRLLDCNHPLASINATLRNTESPESLLYTSASQAAQNLFGTAENKDKPKRLVGRNMTEFLREVKRRMHPVQWKMFRRDQQLVRSRLSNGELTAIARIPIVFEPMGDDGDRRRAYIPLIVQGFQPDSAGESWFNLRVLYLDVTTVTVVEEAPNGDQYYACDLNHMEGKLEALKPFPSVKVFISYTREEASNEVEQLAERLKKLVPYVDFFVDYRIDTADVANAALIKAMSEADLFFVFVSSKPRGPGQTAEIDYLNGKIFQKKAPVIVPVLLEKCQPPEMIDSFEWINWSDLDSKKLKRILLKSFRPRCDDEWADELTEPVKV